VLPVVYKIFSAVLKLNAGDALQVMSAPQFALRAGHQAHEAVFTLRNLVEKYEEWRAPHLFVLYGDIDHAYDYMRHQLVITALDRRAAPRPLTAAWIHTWRKMKSSFKLSAKCNTRMQGDPTAPDIFNVCLGDLATEFLKAATEFQWGLILGDAESDRVSIVLFADNFWLFATSEKMLQKMVHCWANIF
jgi:hypothetical protein